MSKKVLLMNGINLNMFGHRSTNIYGTITFMQIKEEMQKLAQELKVELECFQSNNEGEFVERLHKAYFDKIDGLVIHAGAWSHYSIGIRDAVEILKDIPICEVHMSNIYKREGFRHKSVLSDIVQGEIVGWGLDAYLLALRAVVNASR